MRIESLEPGEVFVFGSNASGAHGAGAALLAHHRFGAVWGQSEGLQGQSYGIDTMSGLGVFQEQAGRFLAFAASRDTARNRSHPSSAALRATSCSRRPSSRCWRARQAHRSVFRKPLPDEGLDGLRWRFPSRACIADRGRPHVRSRQNLPNPPR